MLNFGMSNSLITLAILEQGRAGMSVAMAGWEKKRKSEEYVQERGARFNGAWLPRVFFL